MSSNKAACIMCGYIYTDEEIFRQGKVNHGDMRITCPRCGKFNIHKVEDIMEEDNGINASGSEGSD